MGREVGREVVRSAGVSGVLHSAGERCPRGLVLTHGAGGNMDSALLLALADLFAGHQFTSLRCNLPFRQARPHGPPRPADAAKDREGLAKAAALLRSRGCSEIYLGGQSYGGRQASMLAAENAPIAAGLILLSYPLHPPGKPLQLRTQHFPELRCGALFVSGTKDPFATVEELDAAVRLIPGRTSVMTVEDVGHDLGFSRKKPRHTDLGDRIYSAFTELFQGG